MRGTWVGALCSWCHCPLESGRTLPPQGDAAQPPQLTPRMAEVATAHHLLPDNSRETSTEKRKKREEEEEEEHTTERQARRPFRGSWNVTPAAWKKKTVWARVGYEAPWPVGTLAFGAAAQVRVCSSQTQNLPLSFFKLLVTTCGVQSLERPGKPNSSRHATSPITTEACIIASAGLATLLQATVPCLLSLVPGTPV